MFDKVMMFSINLHWGYNLFSILLEYKGNMGKIIYI
jgi:hypothetical protein